jgi:hypothetical protein
MKKLVTSGLLLSVSVLVNSNYAHEYYQVTNMQEPTFILKYQKESGSLKATYLKELAEIFHTDVFVESGTLMGNTTHNAIPYFREIHTIELSRDLYARAVERFKNNAHVHVHQGDSASVLPHLLPQLKGKILFWLDGHYSEGGTAKGKVNTPLMEELDAIRLCGIKDAVLLIDDIRQFQPVPNNPINQVLLGFPTVTQLKKAIFAINPNYQVFVYGDMALAFLADEKVAVSPVVQACTISRLFGEQGCDIDLTTALEAEKNIINAQGEEKLALQELHKIFAHSEGRHGLGKHFRLWCGLTMLGEKNYIEADAQLRKALDLGCDFSHILFYLSAIGAQK